ncbi:MAG TPA: SUMF1/EgtB/PvdO family nonheme iron enzyme [Gammaproteobacteria bacterium]
MDERVEQSLLDSLREKQQQMISLLESMDDTFDQQPHPDLSPPGWHLGHCVFTENYWIREQLLKQEASETELVNLYNPQFSEKTKRGKQIPSLDKLLAWVFQSQHANLELLKTLDGRALDRSLNRDNYLLHFLIQHYAQHYETLQLAGLQQVSLQEFHYTSTNHLQSQTLTPLTMKLPAGTCKIGADLPWRPYDNEYPAHRVTLAEASVSRLPVSNSQYLAFMETGGYRNSCWWDERGWQWRQSRNPQAPEYWRQDESGHWYVITRQGPAELEPESPVHGINWYEARAFARWAGGRLPHEHEWECACRLGLLENTGEVWEWCDNAFFPYPGFRPYPYDGYSLPYFDGEHYVLKGGSRLTQAEIKRPSFRNYYEAEKRFLYAGLRLVFEA